MKYNVGDRVKIKEYLEYNEIYRGVCVTDSMLKYCGKVVEIAEVNSSFDDRYILKGCENLWFHEDMLEPIKDNEEYETLIKIKGKDGEIVEAKKTLRKEKTSLEKALELLNMTEEEMNKEYYKKDITELGVEITNKFNNYCNNRWKCRGCKYKEYGKTNCNIMFVLNYLKDKEMLIFPTKEDDR